MLHWLSRRFGALRHGARLDRELNTEMRFHIEMEAQKYIREGMTPDAARTLAMRNFGPIERHKEETRDARGVTWVEQAAHDVRYGTRTLLRSPGFALLAVLTLGLGIGANTAIFSVLDGVLLKPLPYENADRLVLIRQSAPGLNQADVGVSIKELYDYRRQLKSFSGLVEVHHMNFDLLRRGEPDRVATAVVSANFFEVLGIKPILGRTFVDADDDHGAPAVLVLAHSYWQTKFAGSGDIVGQVFEMNDRPHTVIGVLPAVPHYPNEVDVYMPTSACPFRAASEANIERNRRAFSALQVFGLLKPGVSEQLAATDVAAAGQRFFHDYPQVYRRNSGFQARTAGVLEELTANAKALLWILLGTTGLVLLIACANVANLTLARMLRRDRELALRTALGAARWRLVRQLLTESLLISIIGGLVGLAFAWLTMDMLTTFVGHFTQRTGDVGLDLRVLAFTGAVSLATGVAFGTLPAFASRFDLIAALKGSGKGTTEGGTRHRRVQSLLVVAQVAVSIVLLTGAGLLLMSFFRLQRVNPGYRGDRVLSAEVFGNFTKYPDAAALRRLYVGMLERLDGAPGVMAAAVTNAVPLAGLQPGQNRVQIRGRVYDNPDLAPTADVRTASVRYFETLGIPVRRGRAFTENDDIDARQVVVINESMIRYWAGQDPIGAEVSFDDGLNWLTVVGVVGDVRSFGLDREAVAQVYRPLRQTGGIAGRVLVRMNGDPDAALGMIRAAVQAVDADLPIENVRTLEEIRETHLAAPRLTAALLTVFASLAMLVTIAGLAGVLGTSVSERTNEFGVRMALGASRSSVLRMVLRQGLLLVVLGLMLGIGVALGLARVLATYLYATPPHDPLSFAAAAVAFIVAGTGACLGPAWRATTVNPMTALRAD